MSDLIAFFEDSQAPAGTPAVWRFARLIERIQVFNRADLAQVLATLTNQPTWTVLALNYELGYWLEPRAAPFNWHPDGQPLATFWRFAECEFLTQEIYLTWLQNQLTIAAGVSKVRPTLTATQYLQACAKIQQAILAGECYQVNFTFKLKFQWFGTPLALYTRLRALQPVRYGGFIGDERSAIVSLSPELFLTRQGKRLVSCPMKGTASRAEPIDLLRNSAKDRAENIMIVDLLRNDLGRIATIGSVKVENIFIIEELPTVRQMVSTISAQVDAVNLQTILQALFPCGSVTGAPKIQAMRIAGNLESEPRGLYCGALGWLAPNGDLRLNVAIRTLILSSDHSGNLGIGSGIVADSQCDAEWRECLLKSDFLSTCDPGLYLFETLLLQAGVYPRLVRHLNRLRRSAHWFGFPYDETKARAILFSQINQVDQIDQIKQKTWRVKLSLNHAGVFSIQVNQLQSLSPGPWHAQLANITIAACDPLRRHKTSAREIYDTALQNLPSNCFDLIFLNERGEVAEGARSNVFVEREGILLTPPVSSGALPGVLRAELLTNKRAHVAILYPKDLIKNCWLGNALHGLIPVKFL